MIFYIILEKMNIINIVKTLAFIINLMLLSPPYDELIKYLCNYSFSSSDRRTIEPSGAVLANVFKILKDEIIIINEKEMKVTLEKVNVVATVDKDYNFKVDFHGDRYKCTNTDTFIINHKKGEVQMLDHLELPDNSCGLLSSLNNKNLSLVKDDFLNQIYPRLSNNIILADEILKKVNNNSYNIELYFDEEDEDIIYKYKFLNNDKEISSSELDYFNSTKKLQIDSILLDLGFINNRLKGLDNKVRFLQIDFKGLRKLADIYLSQSIQNKKLAQFSQPTIRMNQSDSSLIDIFYDDLEYEPQDYSAILRALGLKKKYVKLKDDTILSFKDRDYDFYNIIDELDLKDINDVDSKQLPLYQALKVQVLADNVKFDEYINQMLDDLRNFKNLNIGLPKVDATLRNYQIEGYNYLKVLEKYGLGGILADDMALGKTLQVITLLAASRASMPSLIICPKSLVYNWLYEFKKFAKDLAVTAIIGQAKDRLKIIDNIKNDEKHIYLISYDTLRSEKDHLNLDFNYVILDEAQYIKKVYAQKTKAIKQLKFAHSLALTGTPIENNIIDLWSIFEFIMPAYLEPLNIFKQSSEANYDIIRKKVTPFILRRTKEEVLKDLPAKYEEIITTEMAKEQREIYDSLITKARKELEADKKVMQVLSNLLRLRQLCVSPKLYLENYQGSSAKLEKLTELVTDYIKEDHKILIFSQFVSALDLIKQELLKLNINSYLITGDTPALLRLELVNKFNASDKIKVFLISLRAGGTGLNLTGADTVIHIDPWWNPATENQATDRAHRIGQQKNVRVIKLICEDSIEQKVLELQEFKKNTFNKIISDDSNEISKISLDDLRYILY